MHWASIDALAVRQSRMLRRRQPFVLGLSPLFWRHTHSTQNDDNEYADHHYTDQRPNSHTMAPHDDIAKMDRQDEVMAFLSKVDRAKDEIATAVGTRLNWNNPGMQRGFNLYGARCHCLYSVGNMASKLSPSSRFRGPHTTRG